MGMTQGKPYDECNEGDDNHEKDKTSFHDP